MMSGALPQNTQSRNVGSALRLRSIEQLDGFVSVRGLDHLETFVLQGLCGHQSDDGFILYE